METLRENLALSSQLSEDYHYGQIDSTMIQIPGGSWYEGGSSYDRSNYRVMAEQLRANFADRESHANGWESRWQGDGSESLWIEGSLRSDLCEDCADPLVTLVLGWADALAQYPILDEDDFSSLEMELTDECWNGYGRDDLIAYLDRHFDDDVEVYFTRDEIDTVVFDLWSNSCEYPTFESATDVTFPKLDEEILDALIVILREKTAPQAEILF